MNHVAYTLLEIGKENSECNSAAELSRVSETRGEVTTSVSGSEIVATDRLQKSAVPSREDSRQMGAPQLDAPTAVHQSSSKSLPGSVFSYEEPLGKVSSSQQATNGSDAGHLPSSRSPSSDLSSDEGPGTCSSPFILVSHEDCVPDAPTPHIDAANKDDESKAGSVCYITATENLSQQALKGVDWFLTFEQFLSGLQHEPALCQFFAEQYMMDLMGSNVDPDLSSYTRSFMAKKR